MVYDLLDINKMNQSTDCISILNPDLIILKWNHACEKKFNISSSLAVRSNLLELFPQFKEDYRVACLRDSATLGKSFHFPGMPYEFYEGYYSQLILPLQDLSRELWGTINIVRDQKNDSENYSRSDLLNNILKDEVLASRLLS